AWSKAYNADKVSIFGGIVVLNQEVSLEIAKEMKEVFLEVIVAPGYQKEALELLQTKKNLRVLQIKKDIMVKQSEHAYDLKKINGGLIVQTVDSILLGEKIDNVTVEKPTKEQLEDLLFAMKIVKFAKSNGIVIAKNKQSIGIGPGQVNRIWAAKQSIEHANELIGEGVTKGAVLASDAFFPFDDVVKVAHEAGINAIIQPGGSLRDQDSIDKCNEFKIAMVFTGVRHFKH
ncbi:MAG: bifunctional phosphoribosylaminoimidazolecarboxamide formyltransferase/IMP cyclohydrolase, partial [Bacilli bacterium]|nr:bifunctional phosphoribosylaminoimidazolecarboxamide formyltransferase/IMP cyclohydrolase [Bacilli bacterium]